MQLLLTMVNGIRMKIAKAPCYIKKKRVMAVEQYTSVMIGKTRHKMSAHSMVIEQPW